MVSKEHIIVDPENIRAIMEWETPRNMDEIRSFMGIVLRLNKMMSLVKIKHLH